MVGRKPIIGALLMVALAYGAYPFVTLLRLGHAIRQGDAATLETMVNWDAVREGIKEDICDLVIDEPPQAKANGQLPPFGAGFLRGIATNVVDKQVTPEALVGRGTATRGQADCEQRGAGGELGVLYRSVDIRGGPQFTGPGRSDPAADGPVQWGLACDPRVAATRDAGSVEHADVAANSRPSVAGGAVHHLLERLAVKEAPQVLNEQPGHDLVALRMAAADMGQHDDALGGPEGMLGRQRLLAEHVQHGAGDALRLHRGDQVGIGDQVAAAEVQQPGGRLHLREALGVR